MRRTFLIFAAAWTAIAVGAEERLHFDLIDTEGSRHTEAGLPKVRATVFVFVGTACPLSNRYVPELNRLVQEYTPRGFAFFAVYSGPSLPLDQMAAQVKESGYGFRVLDDRERKLTRAVGATVTPQAVVVNGEGKRLYRGRIDDRMVELGKSRPRPTRHDLRAALDEILMGQAVSQPETKAVGCAIPFPMRKRPSTITFSRHVAPILYDRCSGCHRPGQAAPFSLLSHADAAPRASLIAAVTESRVMPPWKAEAGAARFEGDQRLTVSEIATLREWADAGAPEGDPADLPSPPEFRDGWQLGSPDLVVEMPSAFEIAADGPDLYRCFVLPLSIPANRFVKAMEFRPGNPKLVHHALVFADSSGAARTHDGGDALPGYPCFGAPGFLPSASFGGWSPGSSASRFPEDAAATLRRGAALVLQLHYHPTGKAGSDRSSIGLYFTDQAPTKKLMDIALGSRAIDIPPGERAYRVTDRFTLPVDVWAVGIIPHAHYICKEMKGTAVLPDGRERELISIKDWDFNWQRQYRYEKPVLLPEGTRLEMEFVYDNSEDNPRNPSLPPRRVLWGPDSTDEMAGLHVQVIPLRMEDVPELGRALWGKFMRAVGGRFYNLPQPDASSHLTR
ncbi:MAG: redoxin family protein [Bryobacteraceae bacterium]